MMTKPKVKIKLAMEDSGVNPPAEPFVDYTPKPVLYQANGKPLTRKIGF